MTGFEPFGGAPSNSSWDAVQLVSHHWAGQSRLITARLPVEFGLAGDEIISLIENHSPDLVIATGVAGGRTTITPERVAINLDDARIADNAGSTPVDRPIVAGGPDAYFTGLPVRAMVERMAEAGVPASLSLSAGTYVCNHVMYRMLHHLASRTASLDGAAPPITAGFIHVPDAADLPTETIAAGLTIALEVALSEVESRV